MSAKGHCRHCAEDCRGGDPIPAWPRPEMHSGSLEDAQRAVLAFHLGLCSGANLAQWYDCPACAEAERVADAIIAAAAEHDLSEAQHAAFVRCAAIARGDA